MTKDTSTIVMLVGMCSAAVSLIASSTMSFILFRSTKGLNAPYKRIIFCISCSDIMQSLAVILGPLAIPKGTLSSIAPFAIGNRATCAINGFVASNAINFVAMYTCLLCVYYVCKLQWRMSDDKFRSHVEWVFHLAIFLVNIPLNIAALALDTYHAISYGFCHYNEKYYYDEKYAGCRNGTRDTTTTNSTQTADCDIEHVDTPWRSFILIGGIIIPAITYLGIILCSVLLSRHAILKTREIKLNKTNAGTSTVVSEKIMTNDESAKTAKSSTLQDDKANTDKKVLVPRPLRTNRPQRASVQRRRINVQDLSRLYRKETLTQALLFVISFSIIYITVPFVVIIASVFGNSVRTDLNKSLQFAFAFFFPLGGLFNILVYCRPKVAALRRREDVQNKSISWIRGFVMVVAAGGEIPREKNARMNDLRSEFTEDKNPTPLPSHIPHGDNVERNTIERWNDLCRRDGLDWLMGDYYVEEETLNGIVYARDFNPED